MFRILLMIRLDLATIEKGHFGEEGHINHWMDTMLKESDMASRRGHTVLNRLLECKIKTLLFGSESGKVDNSQQLRRQFVTSPCGLWSSRCDICLFRCVNASGSRSQNKTGSLSFFCEFLHILNDSASIFAFCVVAPPLQKNAEPFT